MILMEILLLKNFVRIGENAFVNTPLKHLNYEKKDWLNQSFFVRPQGLEPWTH